MGLKMNIKAKDDVYEATRQRMAVAEEESKKNWYVITLVIYLLRVFQCLYLSSAWGHVWRHLFSFKKSRFEVKGYRFKN